MSSSRNKEIVLDITDVRESLEDVLRDAKSAGIKRVVSRHEFPPGKELGGFSTIEVSDSDSGSERTAAWIRINDAEDVKRAVEASGRGHGFVIVECSNWKIIPIENMIAEFRRLNRRLYAFMKERSDIESAFSILEKGVDGVVVPSDSLAAARDLIKSLAAASAFFPIGKAAVTRIADIGPGERGCIDTVSQLSAGEGLLVGSKSNFFFLVHGETIPSEYIPTRPFRVNAGAIHSYLLGGDGKTRYISEIEAGDKVQIVSPNGQSRPVAVGRVKIERRPLVLIAARSDHGQEGSVILQKAETIRLIKADGRPLAVTDVKEGDSVMVHLGGGSGRHFGGEVDEFIVER